MKAAILNSAILNSAIMDSTILVFILKLTHTCQDWFPPFAESRLTHLFWLNLMITAILNSAMLNSDTWHLGFRHLVIFSQIHSKTLSLHPESAPKTNSICQTPSFSLNLMMAAIFNLAILDSAILHKLTSLIHSDSTWWWQPSSIWPSCFQPS